MKPLLKTITLLLALLATATVFADGVYQEPAEFIRQTFDDKPPKADVLWLNKDLKKQVEKILDHKYTGLRIRYWQQSDDSYKKSAWVLEEIGKEKMITAGIVINNQQIERVKVLVFRESRGWEVRHDFFTQQFEQAKLKENHQLDKTIDNISGATLSVRAVRKLARIALLLDQHIWNSSSDQQMPRTDSKTEQIK
ncbi:MAG: FMN-binding protein [Gammaproteobacteria bacterium]|nr:FMN-binding protein [Gammaproteobacteria bacterium]